MHPKVHIWTLHMELLDWHGAQMLLRSRKRSKDLLPLLDRIPFVQEAGSDDFFPIALQGHPSFFGHCRRAVKGQSPAEAALIFLVIPPVHIWLEGLSPRHDFLGVYSFHDVHVCV